MDDAVHERRDHLRRRVLRRRGGAGSARGVDAGARHPALDPVDAGGGCRRELRALAGDAGDDDDDDEDGDGHDREQTSAAASARGMCGRVDGRRHRDHGDDERADHRPGDRVRLGEQPDEPEEEREQPDEQPGAGPRSRSQRGVRNESCRRACVFSSAKFRWGVGRDAHPAGVRCVASCPPSAGSLGPVVEARRRRQHDRVNESPGRVGAERWRSGRAVARAEVDDAGGQGEISGKWRAARD